MKNNIDSRAQHLGTAENTLFATAAASMTPDKPFVRAVLSAASYAITLPNVSLMAGKLISVRLDTAAGAYNLTIQDNDESIGWDDIILHDAGDQVLLLSDGTKWHVLSLTGPSPDHTGIYVPFNMQPASVQSDGTVASGTANETNILTMGGVTLEQTVKGTQTIIVPVLLAGGLNVGQDQTDNDGIELTAGILSRSPCAFTVGERAFMARLTFSIGTVAGTDDCAFGFRKAEAYQANIDDYDEMAVLNVITGDIKIETILNNGATTTTDTTNNWADGETHTLEVRVAKTGAVTYLIDGAAPTTVAAFSFDVGEVIVPFFFMLHATAAQAGAVTLKELECRAL